MHRWFKSSHACTSSTTASVKPSLAKAHQLAVLERFAGFYSVLAVKCSSERAGEVGPRDDVRFGLLAQHDLVLANRSVSNTRLAGTGADQS